MVTGTRYWGFGNEWTRLAIAVPPGWLIMFAIVRLVGRWQIVPSGLKDSVGVRKWSRVVSTSSWAGAIAAIIVTVNLHLQVRNLVATLGGSWKSLQWDPVQVLRRIIVQSGIGFAIVGILFVVAISASVMKNRARAAERQGNEQ